MTRKWKHVWLTINFLTWALINSSLLSAKRCLAIILLRSRMHCLSLSDKPNTGRGAGWKGIPPRPLSRKERRKLDKTLCGVPDRAKIEISIPHLAKYLVKLHQRPKAKQHYSMWITIQRWWTVNILSSIQFRNRDLTLCLYFIPCILKFHTIRRAEAIEKLSALFIISKQFTLSKVSRILSTSTHAL